MRSSATWKVVALTLLTLSNSAEGFDPATDHTCRDPGVCLTSFIWCSRENSGDCSYPPNGDAISQGADFAVLYMGEEYDISWRDADPDLPVQIEWRFQNFQYSGNRSYPITRPMWSTNVSSTGPFTFRPADILAEFPTREAPNVTEAEAILGAQDSSNVIRISQPGWAPAEWDEDEVAIFFSQSSYFSVLPDAVKIQVDNLEENRSQDLSDMERRWQVGVGVGVGLGVPLLMTVTWFVARRGVKRNKSSGA